MLYYLGKGTEFKKENCKEYKTIKNVLIAASKDKNLCVWDETGKLIGGLADNIPEGVSTTKLDGSVSVYDENGHQTGTVDTATVKKVTETLKEATVKQNETETCEDEVNTESQGNEIIIPQETTKVTVVCDGTLNLRRSADWGSGSICGRASKGQSYYVKAIHTIQGKKMVQTIDNIYLSGQPEHVKFEKI